MRVRAPTTAELARLAPPNTLLRPMPMVRCVGMFPADEIKENMRQAYALGLPNVKELIGSEREQKGIIIGGGPSIDDQWDRIRDLEDQGYVVVSIDRMLNRCCEQNIVPDYCLAVDASEDVADAFRLPPFTTRFLISSQCRPSVYEALKYRAVYVFNSHQPDVYDEYMATIGDLDGVQINTGGSVVIGAMAVAMTLGMADLHVFGFDCHVGNGAYAKGITGVGGQGTFIKTRIEDRDFDTTLPYLGFAQQFFILRQFGIEAGLLDSIKVYGDSLVNALSRENIRGD